MKARVKSTGELLEVRHKDTGTEYSYVCDMQGECGTMWKESQLEFLDDDPDYWTRLEHQAAIAAMHGFLAGRMEDTYNRVAEFSINQAHALVEKMKEESK